MANAEQNKSQAPKPKIIIQTTPEAAEDAAQLETAVRASEEEQPHAPEPAAEAPAAAVLEQPEQPAEVQPASAPKPVAAAASSKHSKPKVKVQRTFEVDYGESSVEGVAQPVAEQANLEDSVEETSAETVQTPAPKKSFADRVTTARTKVMNTLDAVAPGHSYALLFGFLGLLSAILIFLIGFWKTLFILIMVLLGVMIGEYFDGDPKLINSIRRLFDRDE